MEPRENRRSTRRADRSSNSRSQSQSGATTVTDAPASSRPSLCSATLPVPTTSTCRVSRRAPLRHSSDDLVPGHLPALPLRPAHEHRLEDRDPRGHGRGSDQCRAGHGAQGVAGLTPSGLVPATQAAGRLRIPSLAIPGMPAPPKRTAGRRIAAPPLGGGNPMPPPPR